MISRPTRVLIALAGLGVLSLPAFAQGYGNYSGRGAGELRLHVGDFRPDGKSSYWDGIRQDFTNSDPSDFENPSFGIDYLLPLNDHMSLMFAGNWYEGNTTNSYRNFLDNHNDHTSGADHNHNATDDNYDNYSSADPPEAHSAAAGQHPRLPDGRGRRRDLLVRRRAFLRFDRRHPLEPTDRRNDE